MQKNEPIMIFQEGATVVGRVVSNYAPSQCHSPLIILR